ncbi:MAG: helix-turn-helix domain-containing protein [Thermotogaceae bacterium]|nr:helix-turn-helix domain-containing protein [Thermotogaceae bacterium]
MPIQIGQLRLYDLEELSEKLQINIRSLRKWIREGKIKAKKVGVKYYITEQSLSEYFEKADNRD